MKLVKTSKAWSFSDYTDNSGRFLFKNIHCDAQGYCLPANKAGWELYDNGQLVGFYKTLKAAKSEAENRA